MEAAIPGYVMIISVIASLLLVNGPAPCCWAGSCHSPLGAGFGTCCGNRRLLAGTSEDSSLTGHASECLGRCFEASPRDIIIQALVKTGFEKNTAHPDQIRRPVNLPEFFDRGVQSSTT
ncbi:MAG: hypothetical protein P8182_15565, partial [Deltaproteobacteria bacterium]